MKINDVLDTKKSFVQCIGGNSASNEVGNRTRKIKNNLREKKEGEPVGELMITRMKRREDS